FPLPGSRFPRATLQLPRKQKSLPAGSSAVAFPANVFGGSSNRRPRSRLPSSPINHRNSECVLYSAVAKHYVSEGNTRRLQRESEDDETPQRAFFASEEAHREPAESVVYFLSGLYRSLNQKNTKASISIMHPFIHQYATSHYIFSAFGYTND